MKVVPEIPARAALLVAAVIVLLPTIWQVAAGRLSPDEPAVAARPKAPADSPAGRSLRDHLQSATVTLGDRTCSQWTGTRWFCGPEPWKWVGPYQGKATADGRVRRRACIWVHPEARGGKPAPARITWPDQTLDQHLYGEVALLDTPQEGEAVTFEVSIDGKRVASARASDHQGRRKWVSWKAEVPDPARPHSVTVEVRANNDSWRHVCFTAFTGASAPTEKRP